MLYLDFETIPDFDRRHLWEDDGQSTASADLTPLPVERMPRLTDLLPQSITTIKTAIERAVDGHLIRVPESWLERLEYAEQSTPKPRAGILDYVREIRGAADAMKAAEVARLKLWSVTPEYCRIVAAGWAVDRQEPDAMVDCDGTREAEIIERVWRLIAEARPVCGFNVAAFDLPVLLVRSAILGVPASVCLDQKPWGGDIIDLMTARFGRGKAMGLKALAKLYGISVPDEGMDGSQALDVWRANPLKLADYVKSDVVVTRELHRFYSGYFCL